MYHAARGFILSVNLRGIEQSETRVLILRTLDRRVQTQGSLTVLQWTVFCSSSRQYFVLPADSILFFQLTVFCSSSGQYTDLPADSILIFQRTVYCSSSGQYNILPADSMIYCSSRTGMVLHGLFVSSEQYNSFFFHKIYFENVVKIKDPFKVFFSLNSLNFLYLVRLSL